MLRAVSVPEHAAATGETIEEAARTLRYQIFHELLASGAADAVLTAHTRDDQAETVLMKLLRGAWTEGLSGIHPVVTVAIPNSGRTGRILRPLLGVERSQIEDYLRSLGQEWRTDSSNADPAYTRNRIRHTVLAAAAGGESGAGPDAGQPGRTGAGGGGALADGAGPAAAAAAASGQAGARRRTGGFDGGWGASPFD